MNRTSRILLIAGLFVFPRYIQAADAKTTVKVDHSSPQAVIKSFKQAVNKKDWKTMFACMTPESHKTLTGGIMLAAAFSSFGDEARKKSLEALLKKHGIDPKSKKKPGQDPTAGVKDIAALFGGLVEWLEKNSPAPKDGKPRKSIVKQLGGVELTDFKIEGDRATATVLRNGKKAGQPAEFKKIDGKWYLHFESRVRKRGGKSGKE